MARPTIAEQLKKAAAEGNMEKVQELAGKLNVGKIPKSSKPKVAKKPKKKTEVVEDNEDYEVVDPRSMFSDEEFEEGDVIETEPEDNGFTTSAQSKTRRKSGEVVDENGQSKHYMRTIPYKVHRNRKNEFVDPAANQDLKPDEIQQKLDKTKMPRAPKPKTKKVKVICTRCREPKIVWPAEIMSQNFVCDDCLNSNIRRS